MIHVSCLSRFSKNYAFMIRPQMGHASLAVLAESRSLVPEDASPARDLVLPVVVRPVLSTTIFMSPTNTINPVGVFLNLSVISMLSSPAFSV